MAVTLFLTADGKKPPTLVTKLDGKEYSIRWDEKGIHIWSSQGVSVQLADISDKCRWLIIK